VKYLLKAAAMKAPHLKRFDVICMDDSKNSVRKRFDTFINFSKFRFQDQCITKYMDLNKSLCKESKGNQIIEFNMLEHAHSDFFV
jgi:hypothetical protein